MVYTIWVDLERLIARAGFIGKGYKGEMERARWRRPETPEDWEALTRVAHEMNAQAQKNR